MWSVQGADHPCKCRSGAVDCARGGSTPPHLQRFKSIWGPTQATFGAEQSWKSYKHILPFVGTEIGGGLATTVPLLPVRTLILTLWSATSRTPERSCNAATGINYRAEIKNSPIQPGDSVDRG